MVGKATHPIPRTLRRFLRAELKHEIRTADEHLVMMKFYRELISLRKKIGVQIPLADGDINVADCETERVIIVQRWREEACALFIANLSAAQASVAVSIPRGHWRNVVDSADQTWRGKGSLLPRDFSAESTTSLSLVPWSFAQFVREKVA